jgi:hypothetical protein
MELEPESEPLLFKSRNRKHNFSKVGTVKNSYVSTTLIVEQNRVFPVQNGEGRDMPCNEFSVSYLIIIFPYCELSTASQIAIALPCTFNVIVCL